MNGNVYIETYGCQMNLADTEIIKGILISNGYKITENPDDANVIFLNTCSVRDNAEQRIFGRIGNLKTLKYKREKVVLGVLGCMAERLKEELVSQKNVVDIVVGPDEYKNLPTYINSAFNGNLGIGVKLSRTETYDDIEPYREDGLQAWISVMRGCDKFCTFCVVPFTRGRERSRPLGSIIEEVQKLSDRGFKEVTLLGQNVNSYTDGLHDFADLLEMCAQVDYSMRVRFTTSHPQDISIKLLETIAKYKNICNYIHLPVQSGSDRILELMNRTYNIQHYLKIIDIARKIIPGVSFSTDIIAGFPTETEEDHKMTMDIMKEVQYDGAYMFKYSPREGTKSFKMNDDVSEEVKLRRLQEIINQQQTISNQLNHKMIGSSETVLIEGTSKRDEKYLSGRTDTNKIVIFPSLDGLRIGDYANVKILQANSATLFGETLTEAAS